MTKQTIKITSLFAREILDSVGQLSVGTHIELNNSLPAGAAVALDASAGKQEAALV